MSKSMQCEPQTTQREVIQTGGFRMLSGTVAALKWVTSVLQNQRVPWTTEKI